MLGQRNNDWTNEQKNDIVNSFFHWLNTLMFVISIYDHFYDSNTKDFSVYFYSNCHSMVNIGNKCMCENSHNKYERKIYYRYIPILPSYHSSTEIFLSINWNIEYIIWLVFYSNALADVCSLIHSFIICSYNVFVHYWYWFSCYDTLWITLPLPINHIQFNTLFEFRVIYHYITLFTPLMFCIYELIHVYEFVTMKRFRTNAIKFHAEVIIEYFVYFLWFSLFYNYRVHKMIYEIFFERIYLWFSFVVVAVKAVHQI